MDISTTFHLTIARVKDAGDAGNAGLDERHVGEHHTAAAARLVLGLPHPPLLPGVETGGDSEGTECLQEPLRLHIIDTVQHVRVEQTSEILSILLLMNLIIT